MAHIGPFDNVPMDASVARLPKTELHLHCETDARLDRILALREGRAPFDWVTWAKEVHAQTPPGMPRLERLRVDRIRSVDEVDAIDAQPRNFIESIVRTLEDAASNGATYVELRLGLGTLHQPDFLALFREAELRAQRHWPRLRAEPLITGLIPCRPDRWDNVLPLCLDAARMGLAGIDILPEPYDAEADWTGVGEWTARAADVGLGVTVHAGEFSTANVASVVGLPGVSRLGHGTFAAAEPGLVEAVLRAEITIECCLSSNVVLGGVASYCDHPIRRLVAAGIPVTLNSDDPVRVCTTIAREYAIAAALGVSLGDLLEMSRNAVRAAFTTESRKTALLHDIDAAR